MLRRIAIALLALATPAVAETIQQQEASSAAGGVVRVLDKISGDTTDIQINRGQSEVFGRLTITLDDCRYPTKNPNSDAYAHMDIVEAHDSGKSLPVFSGWMFASSPALSAVDHARYDVWMLRCTNR